MSRKFRDFQCVARPTGLVLMAFGASAFLCAIAGILCNLSYEGEVPWDEGVLPLCMSSVLIVATGALLFFRWRKYSKTKFSRREAILTVSAIWIICGIAGSLPFFISGELSLVDSIFESLSGLTTTGSTVLTDIEAVSMPILIWRSLLQWLGGMGIVVLFVAVFPGVGVGSKHMFRGEAPGATSENLKPRIAETASILWRLYLAFTGLLFLLLLFQGMSGFESLCHALTTMATGGFSTRNDSMGAFSPSIQYTVAIFMLISTVNYGLYFIALRKRNLQCFRESTEFRIFLALIAAFTLGLFLLNYALHDFDLELSFRRSFFMVATSISSTGYSNHAYAASAEYAGYGPAAMGIFILMLLVGGCAGSTSGGIKVERFVIAAKQTWIQIGKVFRPSVVRMVRMGRSVISVEIVTNVMAFFAIYFGCLMGGVFVLSVFDGVPVPTAFGAMLTALCNMGPAPFHDMVPGMSDNFSGYSNGAKLFCAFAMILGRLEFFTIFALMVPDFWRR